MILRHTAIAIALTAHTVCAWDAAGHMLVGQIAWELSSPSTRMAVNALTQNLDHRFNEKRPYHFVTAGCWMDDLRALPQKEYLWSRWHYVDAPKTATGAHFKLPEPPHIVWAIDENLKTLRDQSTEYETRAFALGQLIHWIGDIHQPLHATTWDDRGGNAYLITGVPFSDLMPRVHSNLHTYWDKAFRFDAKDGKIIETWHSPKTSERPLHPGDGPIATEAARILLKYPANILEELKTATTPMSWAEESHILGCKKAYPPGDHPRDTSVRKLTPKFIRANREIAERRIALAGHRLAHILNELFP